MHQEIVDLFAKKFTVDMNLANKAIPFGLNCQDCTIQVMRALESNCIIPEGATEAAIAAAPKRIDLGQIEMLRATKTMDQLKDAIGVKKRGGK